MHRAEDEDASALIELRRARAGLEICEQTTRPLM
jgi:hypothetical protein